MNKLEQARPTSEFDTVIGWLADQDERKREAATSILTRLGPLAVSLLVEEASKPGKRAEHCVAILDIVQQIGGPPEPSMSAGGQNQPRGEIEKQPF